MEWITPALVNWKELGAAGIALLLGYKLLDKLVDWLLARFNINIDRRQSHEDELEAEFKAFKINAEAEFKSLNGVVASQEKRLTRVEGKYDFMHDVAHKAADGIDQEMQARGWISPAISFFIGQLRTIQALEEILKD